MLRVSVERMDKTAAKGMARHHKIITDRTSESGGTDNGPTSGELMLLAVGSCVVGTSRMYIEDHDLSVSHIRADVTVENMEGTDNYGAIHVELDVGEGINDEGRAGIMKAANSGRVTCRLKKASDVVIGWAKK